MFHEKKPAASDLSASISSSEPKQIVKGNGNTSTTTEVSKQEIPAGKGSNQLQQSYSIEEVFERCGGSDEDERTSLAQQLPHREYLIANESVEQHNLFLLLADILFAYCYNIVESHKGSTM